MLQKITTTLFLYLNLQHKTKPIFKIMINLEKGQRVTIDLPKFTIGLGWDTNSSDTGSDFDLDASAFILGENKKILSDEYFVFYNNQKADERRQNFGQVRNSFIRIYNTDTHEEIAKYELEEDFSVETAVEFGRLYKRNGQWKFEAMGIGYKQGLAAFLDKYN